MKLLKDLVVTGTVSASNLSGTNTGDQSLTSLLPAQAGNAGRALVTNGTSVSWEEIAGASGSAPGGAYSTDIGDGVSDSFVVTHNLGTRDLLVAFRETTTPFENAIFTYEVTTEDSITITFTFVPTPSQYRVTIVSGGFSGTDSTPGGADSQFQFNDDGEFAGSADLTYDKVSATLSLKGITLTDETDEFGSHKVLTAPPDRNLKLTTQEATSSTHTAAGSQIVVHGSVADLLGATSGGVKIETGTATTADPLVMALGSSLQVDSSVIQESSYVAGGLTFDGGRVFTPGLETGQSAFSVFGSSVTPFVLDTTSAMANSGGFSVSGGSISTTVGGSNVQLNGGALSISGNTASADGSTGDDPWTLVAGGAALHGGNIGFDSANAQTGRIQLGDATASINGAVDSDTWFGGSISITSGFATTKSGSITIAIPPDEGGSAEHGTITLSAPTTLEIATNGIAYSGAGSWKLNEDEGTAGQVLTSGGPGNPVTWQTVESGSGLPEQLVVGNDEGASTLYLSGINGTAVPGYSVSFAGGNYGSPVTKWGAQFTMGGATATDHGTFTFSGSNVSLDADGHLWVAGSLSAPNFNLTSLLPSQTGNSGKALVTNGTAASWQTVSGGGASDEPRSIAFSMIFGG